MLLLAAVFFFTLGNGIEKVYAKLPLDFSKNDATWI